MAIFREDIVDIDLVKGHVHRTFVNVALGEGDAGADVFGVRVFRNGEAVSVAGSSCIGYFIRSDGVTEVISDGTVSGNLAKVSLPAACYAVEGNFQFSIVLTGGGITGTMRIVDGTVVNVINGAISDPTGDFPNPEEYEALVERAEAAATTIAEYNVTAELIEDEDYEIVVTTIAEGE